MITSIFPTKILNVVEKNSTKINDEIKKTFSYIELTRNYNWGATHLLSTSNFNNNYIDENDLNLLKESINTHVKLYCDSVKCNFNSYKMTSWVSWYKENDYAHIHNHGHADISGVYYVQTSGKDGNIFFTSPCPAAEASKIQNDHIECYRYIPENGLMLLFPGYLNHGVQRNTTKEDRISISFNIYFND